MNVESRMDTISVTADVNSDLAQEPESVKGQLNDLVVSTNDTEQFNRRDILRIKGLLPGMDHRRTVIEFLRAQLSLPVQDEDVAAVHVINTIAGTSITSTHPEHDNMQTEGASASVPASSSGNKDIVFLVKFRSWEKRNEVIRRRKTMKGTRISIAENLTKLNVKTLNRAKSSELVSKVWSWNRRIFALLNTGKRVVVHPFQPISSS